MAAATVNLTIEQGATFSQRLTWKTGEPAAAVNLTGYTARMQVRATTHSTTVLASLTTENGRITLGGTAGTVDLLITAADTAALDPVKGVYDLELISAGGVVTRLCQGSATISAEVTR